MGPKPHAHAALIVDDDDEYRHAVVFYLEAVGFTVRDVSGANRAFAILQDGFRPCAILVDVRLRSESGWDFVRRLRDNAQTAEIPVILVSGTPFDASRAVQAHVQRFLSKPVTPDDLVEAIAEYCDRD